MLDDKLFEDKAWEQMRNLLDEEMPEKKAFLFWKRWFVLIPLFLLFIGGAYAFWSSLNTDIVSNDSQLHSSLSNNETNQIINTAYTDSQESIIDESNNFTEKTHSIQSNQVTSSSVSELTLRTQSNNVEISNHSLTNSEKVKKNNKSNIPSFSSATIDLRENKKNSVLAENIGSVSNNQMTDFGKIQMASNALNSPLGIDNESNLETLIIETIKADNLNSINVDLIYANNLQLPRLELTDNRSLKFDLYGVAGVNYITDFQSFSYYGGIMGELSKDYSPWSINMGLTFETVNLRAKPNLFDFVVEDANVVAEGTSVFSDGNSFQLSRIQLMNVPVFTSYQYKGWKFGLGVNNAFVLNETIDEKLEEERYNSTMSLLNGDQNQINNTYRLGLMKSIDYRFNTKFSIGLRFRYDLTQFRTIGQSNNNRLHSIGFQAAYKLF